MRKRVRHTSVIRFFGAEQSNRIDFNDCHCGSAHSVRLNGCRASQRRTLWRSTRPARLHPRQPGIARRLRDKLLACERVLSGATKP